MEKLTILDFCTRYRVTFNQVQGGLGKVNKRIKVLNFEVVHLKTTGQGGARQKTYIFIDDQVPIFLNSLHPELCGEEKNKSHGELTLANGVTVLNNLFGQFMLHGN